MISNSVNFLRGSEMAFRTLLGSSTRMLHRFQMPHINKCSPMRLDLSAQVQARRKLPRYTRINPLQSQMVSNPWNGTKHLPLPISRIMHFSTFERSQNHHENSNTKFNKVIFSSILGLGALDTLSKTNKDDADEERGLSFSNAEYMSISFPTLYEKFIKEKREYWSLKLEHAIKNNDVELAKLAIQKGADVDFPRKGLDTVLMSDGHLLHLFTLACQKGNIEIIKLMLEKNPSFRTLYRAEYIRIPTMIWKEIPPSISGSVDETYIEVPKGPLKFKNVIDATIEFYPKAEVAALLIQHGAKVTEFSIRKALFFGNFELYRVLIEAADTGLQKKFYQDVQGVKNEFDERIMKLQKTKEN